MEIQLQNVQIPMDSGFQTVGFGSPLNYSRINQKLFFQIRKLKRKRSENSKSVPKIFKKSVEGLKKVEKSHEDLVAIDKSVQRLEEIKIEADDQGLEEIKIEADDKQTLHLDVNQNLHQNSGKREPRKRKSDSNERKSDFNERKSDFNERKSDFDERKSDFDERKSDFSERKSDFYERKSDFKNSIKPKAAKRKKSELNDTGD